MNHTNASGASIAALHFGVADDVRSLTPQQVTKRLMQDRITGSPYKKYSELRGSPSHSESVLKHCERAGMSLEHCNK